VHGTDKEKADVTGCTALMHASAGGQLEVVRLLCEAGADKDRGVLLGEGRASARQLALDGGHQDVAELLREPRPGRAKRPREEGGDTT